MVHHLRDRVSKQTFRNGFTIVKDIRFINEKQGYWSLRLELEPISDKLRKTRSYIVIKNEFGKKEFYPKFDKKCSNQD